MPPKDTTLPQEAPSDVAESTEDQAKNPDPTPHDIKPAVEEYPQPQKGPAAEEERDLTLLQPETSETFSPPTYAELTKTQRFISAHPWLLGLATRALNHLPERMLTRMQEKNAVKWFHFAAGASPAYQDFLARRGVNPSTVETLEDLKQIPPTSKHDFVHTYPLGARLARDGYGNPIIPEKLIESAGSTGEATIWPIPPGGARGLENQMGDYLESLWDIGEIPTAYVSCFSQGMYGGGRVGEAAQLIASNPDYPMTVMTPGSNLDDALRSIEAIQDMGIHEQLILGGYPPFIGALIRAGQEAGIDWPSLDVKFTLGGDGFTEEWRDAIYDAIGVDLESDRNAARIVSGYGATDLGTGGGNSPLSILARRMAYEDPEIRRALWGDVPFIPSICHTNPNFVVWADDEGQLVVNTLTITPQPNYLIGDLGTVHTYKELIQILGRQPTFKESKAEVERKLNKWGFSLSEVPATSLVSILGRASEGRLGTSFDGAVISGRTIETALIEVGVPFADFYASVEADPDDELSLRFTIHIELTPEASYSEENINRLRKEIVDQTLELLIQYNEDYATSYADNPENARPRVIIHRYNQHPSFRERKNDPKNGRLM